MSLRVLASRLVHHGRRLYSEVFIRKRASTVRIADQIVNRAAQEGRLSVTPSSLKQHSFGQRCLKWYANTPAADIRRNAAKRLMYGGRNAVPYLGFVGINLVTGHGLITKDDEVERICEEIRLCLGAINWEKYNVSEHASSLKDVELGDVIAKGCNAIVHEAKWKVPETDVIDTDALHHNESQFITGERAETKSAADQLLTKFNDLNLAVKMMFNYSAESNAAAILKAMNREVVPAREVTTSGQETRRKLLTSHPNIVAMHGAFADSVPSLPEERNLYPAALPSRLYELGNGRNMTLFLVMKRYHTNLQEYLQLHEPSPTTKILLLAQLLEGIEHMVRHRVAHRDLKGDNILLDLSQGLDSPQLVITDFGCCLADDSLGLRLPLGSDEVDRGGNCALMAPEVLNAVPGVWSVIDYSRSDLWAAGTLAYEIFGNANPFYRSRLSATSLDSRSYLELNLPELRNAPRPITMLIQQILKRNPKERPSPAVAANVCHLLLWGPPSVLVAAGKRKIQRRDVLEWLVNEAAASYSQGIAGLEPTVISTVRNTFLSRVHINEIEEALTYFGTV